MSTESASRRTAVVPRFRNAFLLSLALGISVLFLLVIQGFILAVLLAAVFAGLAHPLYRWFLEKSRGRRAVASFGTLFVLLGGIGLPIAGFLTLVANQAVQVSQGAEVWFQDQGDRLEDFRAVLQRIPVVGGLLPEGGIVVDDLREIAGRTGPVLMGALAAATRGTLNLGLQFFVLLYALYYFLIDGPEILRGILSPIPLSKDQKDELLERFVSVTRATLKGSLLIGVIQGALAGLAFWVAGVPGAALWGTVMIVFSILPAVGPPVVWIPAAIYLFVVGQVGAGIALTVWCAVIVSSLDNFLRPRLIGRDARMSDLLILLSTLGGIVLFGALGFIVGPIVAALFVTVWRMYGVAFGEWSEENPQSVGF